MARNEEKHFGRLNRLYLLKEKEEYEKIHPKRPRLESLDTPEEIQKWLPSIKQDIDFYLKKSQVTCYSDAHVEECREKVVQLEKDFKAFVRKIKRLAPSPIDFIPWTSRPYKRKKFGTEDEAISNKEFKPLATPILDEEVKTSAVTVLNTELNVTVMNQPLSFSSHLEKHERNTPDLCSKERQSVSTFNLHNSCQSITCMNYKACDFKCSFKEINKLEKINSNLYSIPAKNIESKKISNIVDYDSSDDESS